NSQQSTVNSQQLTVNSQQPPDGATGIDMTFSRAFSSNKFNSDRSFGGGKGVAPPKKRANHSFG
ncbi:hypothetical protein QT970_17010, partial [Microcoleus sp. herbarium8]|uniref:hypothetical protein n=1 Tax=Microcoleus sp. herbarium8 TaxID=3055436 RepID=UPI002FD41295